MKKILISILFLLILIAPNYVFAGTSQSCPTPAGLGKCPDAIPDFYYNATYTDGACQVRVDCGATGFNCATGTCFGPDAPPPTYACPVGNADWANPDVNLLTQNCCTNGEVPAWNDGDQKWECMLIPSLWQLVGGTGPDIYYNAGKVGIGTNGPDAKLYVAGGSYSANSGNSNNSAYAIGANSIGADESIYSYGAICTGNAWGNCANNNGVVLGIDNNSATVNIPNSGDAFFNGGNVGIGTTSPGEKLTINAGTTNALGIYTDNDSPWALRIRNNATTIRGLDVYQYSGNGNVEFYSNYPSGSTFIMGSDGNVTIGTVLWVGSTSLSDSVLSRGGRLHISTDERLYLLADGGVYVNGAWGGAGNLDVEGDIYGHAGLYINGHVDLYDVAYIQKASIGNMGISPNASLYVGGGSFGSPGSANDAAYALGATSIAADKSIYSYGDICAGNSVGDCSGTNGVTLKNNGGIRAYGNIYAPDNDPESCTWTAYISEEAGSTGISCPSGKFVAGIRCSGSYCDNVSLECCEL